MQVTVTGGLGHPPAVLQYDANDAAYLQALSFAKVIDRTYQTAIYYKPGTYAPSLGYLIVTKDVADKGIIRGTGFGAIVDENNGVTSTIRGGRSPFGQTVLAGDGGLTYSAQSGDNTVIAGGGQNLIDFRHDFGRVAAYTGSGDDTIYGGYGRSTISAGGGDNQIYLSYGRSAVFSTGADTVSLGAEGCDTISVKQGGHDLVLGSQQPGHVMLTFIGGSLASTVESGQGSYTIFGNAGGGKFSGAKAGHNLIEGGSGKVSITGGGEGDTLLGGSADDYIGAGSGNETLGGGGGKDLFDLRIHQHGTGGIINGITDTTTDYSKQDLLDVGGTLNINYALNTYEVHLATGSSLFYLADGTKVVLEGYTGTLSQSSFTKH